MKHEITYRYHVYIINKKGAAKLDCKTDDSKSVYMYVQDFKETGINGYVFDTVLGKVKETF